jgi:alpha-tubulin suppressor-like RCC1 family protein
MAGRITPLTIALIVLVAVGVAPSGVRAAGSPPKYTAAAPPPHARVGIAYAYQFKAAGVPKPTFSRLTGAFPPGLTLTKAGRLAGKPTKVGTFSFRVRARNASGVALTAIRTIKVSRAWKQVSAGDFHTCATTTQGAVRCWGFNGAGQLGNGTTTNRARPVPVKGLGSGVQAVSAGGNHTCALTNTGAVKCWGFNLYGQLGNGTTTNSTTPVPVAGLASGVVAITLGGNDSCARTQGGAMRCWGRGTEGQLGDGALTNRSTPVAVSGMTSGVTAISLGFDHTCAIVAGGAVRCWGFNLSGEVGNGMNANTSVPAAVSGFASGGARIDAGHAHTCAVTTGGAARCWGYGGHGALGNGGAANSNTPVAVTGLSSNTTRIDAGLYQSCAVTTGGAVKCWGGKSGSPSLGTGGTAASSTPVAVTGLSSGVTTISAGGKDAPHTCAVTSDGKLRCWGANSFGQLGDGTTTARAVPVVVPVPA